MDIKELCNAGGDILDIVADAVNRNDYSGLSSNISNTVNRVVKQVREDAQKGTYGSPTHQYGSTTYTKRGQAQYRSVYEKETGAYAGIYKKKEAGVAAQARTQDKAQRNYSKNAALPATVNRKPAGRISGPFQLAWGILATSGFGITAVVMTIMMAVSGGTAFVVLSAVFGLLTVLGITDIVRGSRKIGLVNRFYRYARLIGNKSYIEIADLASQTAQRKEDVLRDLKKMMKKHMFLQGRLDSRQTTFMLTQEAYQQYLEAEQQRVSREAGEQQMRRQQEAQVQNADSAQAQRILKDGNAYIRKVQECNEKIRNEQMSGKLYRLEAIMRRIFEHVQQHPDSAEDLHKFMDYYLPTTTKLLDAYLDMDRQEIAGGNIAATKREIEDTLDIINEAFENLLDSLFEDTAWDISSDISVMKTMMAQEGLTGGKDFKLKNKMQQE